MWRQYSIDDLLTIINLVHHHHTCTPTWVGLLDMCGPPMMGIHFCYFPIARLTFHHVCVLPTWVLPPASCLPLHCLHCTALLHYTATTTHSYVNDNLLCCFFLAPACPPSFTRTHTTSPCTPHSPHSFLLASSSCLCTAYHPAALASCRLTTALHAPLDQEVEVTLIWEVMEVEEVDPWSIGGC